MVRASIALPELDGAQLVIATVDAPVRAQPWWLERVAGLMVGKATAPTAAVVLEGAGGEQVGLVVPPAGERLVLEWRLSGGEGEMLGPPVPAGQVRVQLSVNERGELRALVGPGEGKALGPPLLLGAEASKELGRRPGVALSCTASECAFRNVTWEVRAR